MSQSEYSPKDLKKWQRAIDELKKERALLRKAENSQDRKKILSSTYKVNELVREVRKIPLGAFPSLKT